MPISPAGVRCVGERNGPENLNKRFRALETAVARERHLLTEAQLAALEKAKVDKEVHGEVESEWPGYCGAQEPFSVGPLKGVGRIYPQTFLDTYSTVALVKLYERKTSLTAADLLNDQVVPFFEEHEVPLSRMLTERGTEYCGSPESHEEALYFAIEHIDQTRTKGKSPQTNGLVERLHKTLLTECYHITFRKKSYSTVAELQADFDAWVRYYHEERVPQGRWGYGRAPMRTFLATIPLAKEKL